MMCPLLGRGLDPFDCLRWVLGRWLPKKLDRELDSIFGFLLWPSEIEIECLQAVSRALRAQLNRQTSDDLPELVLDFGTLVGGGPNFSMGSLNSENNCMHGFPIVLRLGVRDCEEGSMPKLMIKMMSSE
jgi:hypothetical protein